MMNLLCFALGFGLCNLIRTFFRSSKTKEQSCKTEQEFSVLSQQAEKWGQQAEEWGQQADQWDRQAEKWAQFAKELYALIEEFEQGIPPQPSSDGDQED